MNISNNELLPIVFTLPVYINGLVIFQATENNLSLPVKIAVSSVMLITHIVQHLVVRL